MKKAGIARRLALAAALFLSTLPSAQAFGERETQALKEISEKFQSVQTMSGDFVQFGPSGEKSGGEFYLARPGRINFTYDPPSAVSVISDGDSVLVFDKKLQTYDIWPLSKTPLKYLLQSNLDLSSFEKVSAVNIEPDLVNVTIVDDSRFGGGTLTLIFDRVTQELRQWSVIDDQGLQTSVSIYNVDTDKKLASSLFKIDYAAATNAARERNR